MHLKCPQRFFLICSSILVLASPAFSETIAIAPLPAPTIAPIAPEKIGPQATISYAGTKPLKVKSKRGFFPLADIRPREVIEVELQFSAVWANTPLVVQAPDGGNLIGKSKAATIAADGTAAFRFQAGDHPGLYRLSIIGGGGSSTLKFWVADPQTPGANPPVLNARN
jgi:hypothetical protein